MLSSNFQKMNRMQWRDAVLHTRKHIDEKLAANFEKEFQIDEWKESGRSVFRLVPKENFNGTYIFYLYSSKLSFEMNLTEWNFITNLALDTGSAVIVPMYPLAPEKSCKEVFEMLQPVYAKNTKGKEIKRLILMGSGYGAGLAMSLSLVAWKEGWRKPDHLYLLSPCMDTEFFDLKLEQELKAASLACNRNVFNDAMKDFNNFYWVKDYAVSMQYTDYTSPYYGDFTDLCNDIVLFSGVNDVYHCYAREFYKKTKKLGVNIRYFEIEDEVEDFLIYGKSLEQKKGWGFLVDSINGTYFTSLREIYPLKLMSDWTKIMPEYFRDDWASKFIYDHKFNFKPLKTKISEYNKLLMAARYCACDSLVRRFVKEYPNGTVIHLGCRLGNMFGRMDNGRIQWYNVDTHNVMSVRRAMYGERSREKTIGRRLVDTSWIQEIKCKPNQGVMFVCNDAFSYLFPHQVREIINQICDAFPGCQLVFSASTATAEFVANMHRKQTVMVRKTRHFALSDAEKLFSAWRSDYRILDEEPIMKYIGIPEESSFLTKLKCKYNLLGYNHRVVRVKLGSEEYKIDYQY